MVTVCGGYTGVEVCVVTVCRGYTGVEVCLVTVGGLLG